MDMLKSKPAMRPKEIQEIEIIPNEDTTLAHPPPFAQVERRLLRHRYSDGSVSRAYFFDTVTLPFADAVAIVIYYIDSNRRIQIGIRESVRPSIYFRKLDHWKSKLDTKEYLTYPEIVAGGIEYGDLETDGIGINGRAALEVFEEAGFEVKPSSFENIGGGVFSSPGSGKEKIHFRAVRVNPGKQEIPGGDGHPLEEVGKLVFIEIRDLLTECQTGEIEDSKTEIGARRLADHLGFIPELNLWQDELPPELKSAYCSLGLSLPRSENENQKTKISIQKKRSRIPTSVSHQSNNAYKNVSAALIISENKILITQRPPDKMFPLKWEFPGGKTDSGETSEECLVREIKEELNVEIEILEPFGIIRYKYPDFSVSLNTFWCKMKKGTIQLLEHNDCRWVHTEELGSFDFVDADRLLISKLTKEGIPPALSEG